MEWLKAWFAQKSQKFWILNFTIILLNLFSCIDTKDEVKILNICFLDLRFSCATLINLSNAIQFHGTPRIWDGKTIREKIKGNSVLYIVMEDNQVCLK